MKHHVIIHPENGEGKLIARLGNRSSSSSTTITRGVFIRGETLLTKTRHCLRFLNDLTYDKILKVVIISNLGQRQKSA